MTSFIESPDKYTLVHYGIYNVSEDEYNDLTIYGNPSAFVKSIFS